MQPRLAALRRARSQGPRGGSAKFRQRSLLSRNLESLDLSDCQVEKLPEEPGLLSKLTSLSVAGGHLAHVDRGEDEDEEPDEGTAEAEAEEAFPPALAGFELSPSPRPLLLWFPSGPVRRVEAQVSALLGALLQLPHGRFRGPAPLRLPSVLCLACFQT